MNKPLHRSMKTAATLSLATLCIVAGWAAASEDAPVTTPTQACFIASQAYTVGAVAKYQGAYYRCMPVHVGAIENPPTLAWQDQPLR